MNDKLFFFFIQYNFLIREYYIVLYSILKNHIIDTTQ